MKLNFNVELVDLDGKPFQDALPVGKLLASFLSQSKSGDALKLWDWAMKLHGEKELDLDPSDIQTLKTFINQNENLTVLVKSQMLAVFDKKTK